MTKQIQTVGDWKLIVEEVRGGSKCKKCHPGKPNKSGNMCHHPFGTSCYHKHLEPREMIDRLTDVDPLAWMIATDVSKSPKIKGWSGRNRHTWHASYQVSFDIASNKKQAREHAVKKLNQMMEKQISLGTRAKIKKHLISVKKRPNGWECFVNNY